MAVGGLSDAVAECKAYIIARIARPLGYQDSEFEEIRKFRKLQIEIWQFL